MVVCLFPKEVALGALLLVVLLLIKGPHTFPLIPEELWGVSGVGRLGGGALFHCSGNNDETHEREASSSAFWWKVLPTCIPSC